MNGLFSTWWFRAGVVAGLTWAAWKYAPLGAWGKTAVVAVGAVATTGIVSQGVPLVGQVLAGRLPGPAA